jgi:hypothetical protein
MQGIYQNEDICRELFNEIDTGVDQMQQDLEDQ